MGFFFHEVENIVFIEFSFINRVPFFLSPALPHPLSLSLPFSLFFPLPLPFSLLWRRLQPILDDGGLGLALAVDLDPGVTVLSYKNWGKL